MYPVPDMLFLSQNPPPWIFKCAIYPTGAAAPLLFWMPITHGVPRRQPFWPEDLDIIPWFPYGFVSTRLSQVPGTVRALHCDYRIFISRRASSVPWNTSTIARFGRPWIGNILIVKYGRRVINSVVQMHDADLQVLDVILPM